MIQVLKFIMSIEIHYKYSNSRHDTHIGYRCMTTATLQHK